MTGATPPSPPMAMRGVGPESPSPPTQDSNISQSGIEDMHRKGEFEPSDSCGVLFETMDILDCWSDYVICGVTPPYSCYNTQITTTRSIAVIFRNAGCTTNSSLGGCSHPVMHFLTILLVLVGSHYMGLGVCEYLVPCTEPNKSNQYEYFYFH